MSSKGTVVLAAAMAVSSTVIFLAFSRQMKPLPSPPKQTLRSCLCSEGRKRERKKKKVHFAEDVKDPSGNGEDYRREHSKKSSSSSSSTIAATRTRATKVETICRNEMPANRVALYHGILRDRVHRIECSY